MAKIGLMGLGRKRVQEVKRGGAKKSKKVGAKNSGANRPEKLGGMRTASGAIALSKAKRGTVSARKGILSDVAANKPREKTLSKRKGEINRPRRGDMVRSSGLK